MLVGRFIRQLVFASIAVAVVASNPRAGWSPNLWFYSCSAKIGVMLKDGEIKVLKKYFGTLFLCG